MLVLFLFPLLNIFLPGQLFTNHPQTWWQTLFFKQYESINQRLQRGELDCSIVQLKAKFEKLCSASIQKGKKNFRGGYLAPVGNSLKQLHRFLELHGYNCSTTPEKVLGFKRLSRGVMCLLTCTCFRAFLPLQIRSAVWSTRQSWYRQSSFSNCLI